MKKLRKTLALALCLVLALALLPATSAAEADLRAVAVAQAEAIANVPWTLEDRVVKANVTGQRLDYFNANGIFPTTYFEYERLRFPLRGVMVESNLASLEKFRTMIDDGAAKVSGIGHIGKRDAYYGMDVNAFLTDVLSRVSPAKVTGFRQALTDPSLEALLPGADLNAASSKAAIGSRDARAAYAKMQPGDLLLAWDDAADVTVEPMIHAMVVKSVDAAKGTAVVIYPSFNLLLWHFKCDLCGKEDTEGPTSAALPGHVNSSGYTFGSFKSHRDTDPSANCGGTWQPVYASTWRTDTVTFDQLAGVGEQKVLDASRGYLPYTVKAYTAAPTPADVKVTTSTTAGTVAGGLRASVSSNYRISSFEAVLTKKGGSVRRFVSAPEWDSWSCEYHDPALDLALLDCDPGDYTLTLDVRSGPVTDPNTLEVPAVRAFELDFSLSEAAMRISLDRTFVHQGQPVQVTISTLEAGMTAVRAVLSYDADNWVFDPAASKAANPKASFTDNGDGTVTAEYYGAALPSGAAAASPVFNARRTGFLPKAAEETGPFYLSGLFSSKKEGATAADLVGFRPDTTPLQVGIGMNAVIYRNYAGGNDLILAFMCTPEMTASTSDSSIAMTYDGHPMIDVSTAHYKVDNDSFVRIYAYLAPAASADKLAVGSTKCVELNYDGDVNMSGWVDMNDVQAIDNIIRGRLPLEGNMTRWLQADVNRDGKADAADMTALIARLMK